MAQLSVFVLIQVLQSVVHWPPPLEEVHLALPMGEKLEIGIG